MKIRYKTYPHLASKSDIKSLGESIKINKETLVTFL
jgi:hypothetical protein